MMANDERRKIAPVPCSACAYKSVCGGLPGEPYLFGCWDRCITENRCNKVDWVCPCKGARFHERLQEVDGLEHRPLKQLHRISESLPLYIPKLHHAYRRRRPANLPFVALSTYDVFAYRAEYSSKVATADELRDAFRVPATAKVLLLSVGQDPRLERYWQNRATPAGTLRIGAPNLLAQMGVTAITAPNFSYFTDGPRPQTLYNARRTHICVEELTEAGLSVVLHLNSETDADWERWTSVLRDQPHVQYVAKEFETGKRRRGRGLEALSHLRRLQDDLGRPLHPVIIGGTQYLTEAARAFERITFVDSTPAMRTANHKRAFRDDFGQLHWEPNKTPKGKPVDCLLELNVRIYGEWLADKVAAVRPSLRQLVLGLGDSVSTLDDKGRRSLPVAAFKASPVVAKCPHCGVSGDPEQDFGFRIIDGRRVRQSWCRLCRATVGRNRAGTS